VGCSSGGLGAAVKQLTGAVTHGIEVVPGIAEIAAKRMDRVWKTTVEAALAEIPDGYYDCIVAADVLEHLVDPSAVLTGLRQKLSDDGVIVISIPNLQNWQVVSALLEGTFEYSNEGILDRTHLRFFTRRSFEELIWNAGLHIDKMRTTVGGPAVPEDLVNKLKSYGLECDSLHRDGQTFQFVVQATLPPPHKPRVTLVVLNWNGKDDTIRCLDSIKGLQYSNYTVLVVDNGSSDDSVSAIRASHPDIRIIETGRNLGYAGGNNIGIRQAIQDGAEYILVLNNDTVVDEYLLDSLISASNILPKNSIIGSAIFYLDRPEVLWYRGGRWDPKRQRLLHEGIGQHLDQEQPEIREVDYVTGCALFAHRSVFETLGGFDEAYFLTYEETDFCYRARAAGYRSFVTTSAKLWHSVSASFGGEESPLVRYFMTRNSLRWASAHLGRKTLWQLRRRMLLDLRKLLLPRFVYSGNSMSMKGLWWSLHGWWQQTKRAWRNPYAIAARAGLIHHFLHRYGDCPEFIRRLSKSSPASP
jgi:GT2 family glycosyltransferase